MVYFAFNMLFLAKKKKVFSSPFPSPFTPYFTSNPTLTQTIKKRRKAAMIPLLPHHHPQIPITHFKPPHHPMPIPSVFPFLPLEQPPKKKDRINNKS